MQPKNVMEIFRLLDKSNCRDCGKKTCLAFAGAVFKGEKPLSDCPKLDKETIEMVMPDAAPRSTEENRDEYMAMLKEQVAAMDLSKAADRTGGRFARGRLTLKILGKDFSVSEDGDLSADIHVNPWVAMPFLYYVLHGKGVDARGNWVSFRELPGGQERYPLFCKRCEEPMKQVADSYTDLFDDMVHIFNGRQVEKQFKSDISVVLNPLPKVPIMICYWLPDEGLASSLNLFFDETVSDNLDIGSIFSLGAGLAQMFEKLSLRHGGLKSASK